MPLVTLATLTSGSQRWKVSLNQWGALLNHFFSHKGALLSTGNSETNGSEITDKIWCFLKEKRHLSHLHKSVPVHQPHQNLIWKVEANVYLVNKLSNSAASSQLFQACALYLEQTHMAPEILPHGGNVINPAPWPQLIFDLCLSKYNYRDAHAGLRRDPCGVGLILFCSYHRAGGEEEKGGHGGSEAEGNTNGAVWAKLRSFLQHRGIKRGPVWVVCLCNVFYRTCLCVRVCFLGWGWWKGWERRSSKGMSVLFLSSLSLLLREGFQIRFIVTHPTGVFLRKGYGGN